METILLSFLIVVVAVAGMAVGVLFSNRRLKGSCGGLNKVMGEDCEFCDKKDRCLDEDRCVGEDECEDKIKEEKN